MSMKKKLKKVSESYRIEIFILNKYLDNDDTIIKQPNQNKINMKTSQEDYAFAKELAEALHDKEAITLYITFVQKFPESLLREVLAKVLAVPKNKIKKTRGALFNFLMQQHERSAEYDSRD